MGKIGESVPPRRELKVSQPCLEGHKLSPGADLQDLDGTRCRLLESTNRLATSGLSLEASVASTSLVNWKVSLSNKSTPAAVCVLLTAIPAVSMEAMVEPPP